MSRYTIVQVVNKCVRCKGCMIACHRQNKLASANGAANAVSGHNQVIVKSQNSDYDMGPFVRYNCWHCPNPPCAKACPWGAIYEHNDSNGDLRGVDVDWSYCHYMANGSFTDKRTGAGKQGTCTVQCRRECNRGGYPKPGSNPAADVAAGRPAGTKAYKCHLCASSIIAGTLQNNVPACVQGCPAGSLKYGKLTNNTLVDASNNVLVNFTTMKYNANEVDPSAPVWKDFSYMASMGGFVWISNKKFVPPTSDPYVEDHLTPLMSRYLLSPAGMSLLMPAALVGGLYGVIKRRMDLQKAGVS